MTAAKLPLFVGSIGSWTKRSFGFGARNGGWFEDCFILPFIGGIRLVCAAWTLTYVLRGNEAIERDELNLSRREFRAFDGETCEAHKISILKDETIATVIYDDEPGSGVSLRTCVAQGLASGAKFSLFATQDSSKNAISANAPRVVALIWDAIFRIFARI